MMRNIGQNTLKKGGNVRDNILEHIKRRRKNGQRSGTERTPDE
jgi:hypothetical protein